MASVARTSVQPHKHPPHTTSRSLAEASKLSQHRSQFSQNHISPSVSPPPLTVRYPTSQAPTLSTPATKPSPSTQPSKPSPSVQSSKPSTQAQALQLPNLQAPTLQVENLQAPTLQVETLQAPTLQVPDLQAPSIEVPDLQSSAPPQLSPQHVPMQPLSKPPTEPPLLQPVLKEPADPSEWTIDETISHISYLDPSLGPHVENFRIHEIDGKALLLLTSDMMMKYLGLKLGPALKICNIIDKLKGKKHLPIG